MIEVLKTGMQRFRTHKMLWYQAGFRLFLTLTLLTLWFKYSPAQEIILKFGTLAPVGSMWYDLWEDTAKNVKEKLGGKIKFITYPGGVMGDEEEMIKKIRIGQIHAGGFTINGLKKIAPELGVLDVPMLFRNYKEVDYIVEKFLPEFEQFFEKRGYKLIILTEQGFVYFFSKKPVNGFQDIGKTRLWAWKGERVMAKIAKVLGTSPIFLSVPDLLSGLDTGMIESFQTSPMACLSLQWCKLVKSMINYPYRYEPGVVVIDKNVWDKLPTDVKNVMEEEAKKGSKTYNPKIREAQRNTVEKLKSMGVQLITPSENEIKWLEQKVKEELWFAEDTEYPHELLKRIISELEKFRKGS